MRIGFLLTPNFSLMSAASAIEPLRAANELAGATLYEISFISVCGGSIRSSVGTEFLTRSTAQSGCLFDVVFVVAGGLQDGRVDPEIGKYLRQLEANNVKLGGISAGPVILAKLGLLKNRHFAVHEQYVGALKELSRDLRPQGSLCVIDGNRLTCAGGVSTLDMMLLLIAADQGDELARWVSDWFIHRATSKGTVLLAAESRNRNSWSPALQMAVDAMATHLEDPLSETQLAVVSELSVRQLQRLFRNEVGESVMSYYRRIRAQRADELIRTSRMTLADIAARTGFSSASHLCRVYRREFGVPPKCRKTECGRTNRSSCVSNRI